MKKLRVLSICMLATCLLLGAAVPVHASPGEQDPPPLTIEDIDPDELEELNELELMPVPLPGKKVSIEGGFKGVWGTDNSQTDGRPGKVAGIYGRVEYENGTGYGFFGGLWRDSSGRMAGYLKGRHGDGYFRGVWHCLETGLGGPVKGKYFPAPVATSNEARYHFLGKWTTRDGQLTGYLKGSWAPLTMVKREGRFAGQWMYDNQLTAAGIHPDGKLAGNYGVAVFKDGTRIHYFGGMWKSRDGEKGRLGGLIIVRRFCGLWNSDNSHSHGYLKGIWRNNRFKGIWGHFGQGADGKLWGVYRPFMTPAPVDKQPVPDQQTMLAPAAR